MTKIDMDHVVMLIEIRGVYDGWSIAEMDDGRLINRWDQDDPRWLPTEDYKDGMMLDREEEYLWGQCIAYCQECFTEVPLEYLYCAGCQRDRNEERS